jgi:hypothetical protein
MFKQFTAVYLFLAMATLARPAHAINCRDLLTGTPSQDLNRLFLDKVKSDDMNYREGNLMNTIMIREISLASGELGLVKNGQEFVVTPSNQIFVVGAKGVRKSVGQIGQQYGRILDIQPMKDGSFLVVTEAQFVSIEKIGGVKTHALNNGDLKAQKVQTANDRALFATTSDGKIVEISQNFSGYREIYNFGRSSFSEDFIRDFSVLPGGKILAAVESNMKHPDGHSIPTHSLMLIDPSVSREAGGRPVVANIPLAFTPKSLYIDRNTVLVGTKGGLLGFVIGNSKDKPNDYWLGPRDPLLIGEIGNSEVESISVENSTVTVVEKRLDQQGRRIIRNYQIRNIEDADRWWLHR